MRFLFALVACVLIACFARGEDKPQYFLKADGTVEARVAKVESEVERLAARVAELEKALGQTAAKPKAGPSAASIAPAKVRYSVCVGGRCTIYEADEGAAIPPGATLLSGSTVKESLKVAGSPCPTGGCGDACGCVGTVSSGWYPGKLLGRRR